MCSNLFIIPSHLGGWQLFGFGLLFWLLLLAAGGWATWSLRRPSGKDEVFAAIPVLAIMAAAIVFMPHVFPEGFPVRGYGTMLIVAAVSGLALAMRRARQAGLHPDIMISLAFWMFVCGIAGGRLFYVIEYWEAIYAKLPLHRAVIEAFKYANGGLVVYGALAGAALAFGVFMRRHRLPLLAMADLVAPSLVVGLAFGRIGCLLNGCCFGGVCDLPWAISFPKEHQTRYSPPYEAQLAHGEFFGLRLAENEGRLVVSSVDSHSFAAAEGLTVGDEVTQLGGEQVAHLRDVAPLVERALVEARPLPVQTAAGLTITLPAQELPERSLPVHPTQLYSAINAGLLALFLWSYYPARRRDGEVFALLITFYAIARFLLEMIRIDESSFLGTGLSISQNISLVLLAVVAGLWIYLFRRPRERVFDPPMVVPQPA
ncbi:MAG: prolipoprotein diacylglyceryl transferase family protein [Aeoliella sp.]